MADNTHAQSVSLMAEIRMQKNRVEIVTLAIDLLQTHHDIVTEFGHGLGHRRHFPVFIKLGFPALGHGRDRPRPNNKRYLILQFDGQLFGKVSLQQNVRLELAGKTAHQGDCFGHLAFWKCYMPKFCQKYH